MVVGVRGFWGAAKPQAVSRCARFFWGGGVVGGFYYLLHGVEP